MSLLDRAKKKSGGKKKPAAKKSSIRVLAVPTNLHPKIRELCELANIQGEVSPLVDQRKKAIAAEFFNLWTEEMWKSRTQPDNFKVVLQGAEKANADMNDVACNFVLKFNKNGLGKRIPKDSESDQSVEEIVVEMLTSGAVGLTEAKAREFIQSEVEVQDRITLAHSFDEMYAQPKDSELHQVAVKILTYAQARTKAKSGKVNLPAWTEAEEEAAFVTEQIVLLKEGFGQRIFTYCEGKDDDDTQKNGLERLRKLLRFLNITTQVSNFEFGMSDEAATRAKRMETSIGRYLLPSA